ncbi:MAG: SRPBCC family protein [Bacteroidetes bacterium]|nr:SRPBCC family protein [Bacteroidota bacterium]
MKIYRLEYKQFIKAPLSRVWDFFSAPANLGKITPAQMNFKIIRMDGDRMFAGQQIEYKVTVMPLVRVTWVTKITEVEENKMFVDEQLKGPYNLWRHRHTFVEVEGGVEMTDVIDYAIPFGILGRLANWLYVERAVKGIFSYRSGVTEKIFID